MTNELIGKSALIIGASQGIGWASAKALARNGATVVIMGRSKGALRKAKSALKSIVTGARVELFFGDATDENQVKSAIDFTYKLEGRLDIVVSVVGGPTFVPLLMRDLDSVRKEFDVNFISAFLAIRHAAPLMQRGGSIICVSSSAATQACWGLSIYGAAKSALERLVRAAAYELAGAGIRINAVRPGATMAEDRLQHEPKIQKPMQAFSNMTPFGRLGHPDDIARVVRFFAGPESEWVTGQTFSVDGGLDQNAGPDLMDSFFGKEVMRRVRAGEAASPA